MPRPAALDARVLAAIFAGGVVGTLVRAALAESISQTPGRWPWATFAANVVGAALLGWIATSLGDRSPPSRYGRPLLATGFCGALTTFSTMQIELLRMIDVGRYGLAFGYAAASIGLGLAAVFLASAAARRRPASA